MWSSFNHLHFVDTWQLKWRECEQAWLNEKHLLIEVIRFTDVFWHIGNVF